MNEIRRFEGNPFDIKGLISGEMLFRTQNVIENPSGAAGHSEADAKKVFWQHQIPEEIMRERMPGADAYVQVLRDYPAGTNIELVIVPKGGKTRAEDPQHSLQYAVSTGSITARKIKEPEGLGLLESQLGSLFGEKRRIGIQTQKLDENNAIARAFKDFVHLAVPNFRIKSDNYAQNREQWHELLSPFEGKIRGFKTHQTIKLVR